MKKIEYINGDATDPKGDGPKILVHICNDIGGWGKGFVMAISNRWAQPEKAYREWYKSQKNFGLGKVQLVKVEDNLWIANLIGQHMINKDKSGLPPIRYESLKMGLGEVGEFAEDMTASIHMPRIGCGLAGGKWEKVENIIREELIANNIKVTVYDFS